MKRNILLLVLLFPFTLAAQIDSNVHFAGHWADMNLPPVTFLGDQRFNEVWGYEQNGREYAIVGSTMGTHFIDITDISNIHEVDFVQGKSNGNYIVHRDFKNYRHYLYSVCDEGASSLQVIDMQYLPDSVHVVYDEDSSLVRAHNVFIDTSMAKLYCLGASQTDNGPPSAMRIFSISDPENPVWIGAFDHPTFNYVHDAYIHNDTALLNCGNSGFYYGDFSDPQNPLEIGSLIAYPDQGYNHSGWLTPDKKHYVMADETHGMRLKILDMQPGPNLLSFHGLFGSGVNSYSIPHNPITKDNLVFVSYYYDGLQVFDISDVDNPMRVAYYDTCPQDAVNGGYAGAWGIYPLLPSGKILVSDMQDGLFVLQMDLPSTGVVENSTGSPEVFPNPAIDQLQIKGDKNWVTLEIFSVNGQLLQKQHFQNTIPVSSLNPGIYLLRLTDESNRFTTLKFIRQ